LAETAEAVSDRYLQGLESSDDKVKTNTPVPDMGGVSDFVTPVKEHVLTTAMDGKRVFKASEFYDHDICKAIRHDFGDMPVYTIDSSDTRDVDDGVSIEKIKGPDGNFKTWLHIHIADPTALIHPGHIITESAIRSPQSIYIPEMTINMIPKNLLEAKLSLGSRSKGMPTYTMTFSVCLSDDGNIAEYKVQPGVVHNITAVPYDVLDQFADFNLCNHVYSSFEDIQSKKRHSTFIHPFMKEDSDSFENIGDPSKLPTRVVPDLLSMQKVAMCHFRYRVGQGSFTRVLTELDIEVGHDGRMEQPGPDIGSVPAFLSSRFTADKYDWKMFPKIKSVSDLHSYTPSHVFVGELMIMAGRVAAKFCHDRRLDPWYWSQHPPPGFYDPKSPYYQDTPWAYYNPQKPGPLVWTATVDNRSELRPFISLVIDNIAIRAMLVPRPIDQEKLPFAGTKVRVQVIGVEPHRQMLIVKLAPEELQPAETPRFWDSKHAVNYLTSELSHLQLLP
ncbi:3'-5' RNA exonuclease complex component, partial [Coemansia sp. RSA 2049]